MTRYKVSSINLFKTQFEMWIKTMELIDFDNLNY